MDNELHSDMVQIMNENDVCIGKNYLEGSFARIFWKSQKQAATLKDARSIWWDPLMIRWCLYLRHLSSSSYDMICESGVITLPSQRILHDYTYYILKPLVDFLMM